MRPILLGLLLLAACHRGKPESDTEAAPSETAPAVAAQSEVPTTYSLAELNKRVRSKMGPEYLDELIERASTPASRAVTVEKIKSSPRVYFGHPWMFSGRMVRVKQLPNEGCQLSIAIDGTDDMRMLVFGNFNTDFVRGEEVDVVGYLAGHDDLVPLVMLAHSVLKKGTLSARLPR